MRVKQSAVPLKIQTKRLLIYLTCETGSFLINTTPKVHLWNSACIIGIANIDVPNVFELWSHDCLLPNNYFKVMQSDQFMN